ncbi:ABC transporter ATP-binding protein [Streptomyces sparsogenes]|uniref:ABC transporter-like protein n=1 Tax=Streptomyces sparsogenes DSM 40356 TaxID=1331668 RepID=A0A1R1SAL1_9ACTN|nr:ABC transporter ATP-binding protein [Streptomyces sparsogenes]OMI35208.1 ABC transporter-like protein [Streptomyces sparsogenes DSM 40356]
MSLNLTDITLTYPDGDSRLTALDRVTLDAPRGSLTAVVGPSGSGKSSLLAVAATLIGPDAGTVTIDGTSTTGMTRGELTGLRRRAIGIVFQQPNLLPSLTAAEQLQVMAHIGGRPAARARGRAMELLDAVGLADHAHRRPHQLSGGQRQRVNIARALMNDPTVLLIDEPTSALDHERGAAVIDLITRLTHQQATATVLVTHDRTHLTAVDRIAEVHDGRLRLQRDDLATRGTEA